MVALEIIMITIIVALGRVGRQQRRGSWLMHIDVVKSIASRDLGSRDAQVALFAPAMPAPPVPHEIRSQSDPGEDDGQQGAEHGKRRIDSDLEVELAGQHGDLVQTPYGAEAEDQAGQAGPYTDAREAECESRMAHELGAREGAQKGYGYGRRNQAGVPLGIQSPVGPFDAANVNWRVRHCGIGFDTRANNNNNNTDKKKPEGKRKKRKKHDSE